MSVTSEKAPAGAAEGSSSEEQQVILVIDNDEVALELMQRVLARERYHVVTAHNGDEGLRLARRWRPTAVLLDVEMPGRSGWEVLTALKADPELATIPVVMTTMVDERTKGFALGVADYLVKPIERARLAAILKKFPSQKPALRALIVEDDAASRELLARLVAKEGWSSLAAENGRAALERIAESPPDLILLDLTLPELDGFAFLRELRKMPAAQSIPVVVISAKDLSVEECTRLSDGRVQKFFQKGAYTREELQHEIRTRRVIPARAQSTATPKR